MASSSIEHNMLCSILDDASISDKGIKAQINFDYDASAINQSYTSSN